MASETEDMRANDDRRFLTRDDPGRRSDDRDSTTFLSESDVGPRYTPGSYLFLVLAILMIGTVTVRALNTRLAPMLFDEPFVTQTARKMHAGMNYATYDLNIETRGLRRDHIHSLEERPDFIVMGASHWQEAHGALMPGVRYYNAHVHRDYYEDIVTVVYWLVKADKLPEKLVISIRDNQFTPPDERTDFLWVPVLDDYREAARFFDLEAHQVYANGLTPQLRQILSLQILRDNVLRYFDAGDHPHPTRATANESLDVLLSDGAIYWSEKHRRSYTRERTFRQSRLLADGKRESPPKLNAEGLAQVERVFAYLHTHGVDVYIAHPPFNPIVWEELLGTPYMEGLERLQQTVAEMAGRYGFQVIGSFNPHDVGCTTEMYIDGEHSSPECLGNILLQAQ